jgi:hypothetical protein
MMNVRRAGGYAVSIYHMKKSNREGEKGEKEKVKKREKNHFSPFYSPSRLKFFPYNTVAP